MKALKLIFAPAIILTTAAFISCQTGRANYNFNSAKPEKIELGGLKVSLGDSRAPVLKQLEEVYNQQPVFNTEKNSYSVKVNKQAIVLYFSKDDRLVTAQRVFYGEGYAFYSFLSDMEEVFGKNMKVEKNDLGTIVSWQFQNRYHYMLAENKKGNIIVTFSEM